MHGYELVKEYERQEVADWAPVSRAHVYYALKRLAASKLIEAQRDRAKNARDRVVYRVSAAGKRELALALQHPSWATQRPPAPFLTWLGLSIHANPADVRALIGIRRDYLQQQIDKETATLSAILADDGARVGVAAHMVRFCIRQFNLEKKWLDEVAQGAAER
jgi:DNA-binding PadR family transcriptional regulator